jgi:membrane-bound lytic murein transglycosylase D
MQRFARICVTGLLAVTAGCAGQGFEKKAPAAPAAVVDAAAAERITALYQRLDADEKRYTQARAAAAAGNAAQTAAETKAALDDLQAAATACFAVAECEGQRFIAALDHLLRAESGLLGADTSNPAPDGADGGEEDSGAQGVSSPAAAALPQIKRSVALLKGRELSDVIALNDPVKVALEQWLTQLRPNLMVAYENYEYLRHRMWPEYQKAGLPEAVLFGMLAKESGGKVHAVSRSGASGPLQFMYATGARFGLGNVNGFDQRFDPQLSARANAAYLNEQLAVFNDNLELVLGAYNGGEGAMRRLASRNPDASFWDPKIYFELSPETRDYVPMVLAAAWLFLHPERYHLSFPHIDEQSASIALKQPASIDELTICLGQEGNPDGWFRTLRNLNPTYDPSDPIAAGTRIELPKQLVDVYDKSCSGGKWVQLASELHGAAMPVEPPHPHRSSRVASRSYVVRKGDSLGAIARRVGCADAHDLAVANHIKPPRYALRAGQTLRRPACGR